MIKAIFFDASETLIHLPGGVAFHYASVARQHGVLLQEKEIAAAFRTVWKSRPARSVSAGPRPDDDKSWWQELVAEVFTHCGIVLSPASLAELFESLYAHFAQPGVWALYPDVRPALELLHGQFALGVISNFDARLHTILAQLGIAPYFDAILVSSENGADKPHPQIYRRALARLHVAPPEALHVGDDPIHDWQGSSSAGLHSFPLQRPENSLLDLPAWLAATNRSGS